MKISHDLTRARIARWMRQCLEKGATVDIDGLGTFLPCPRRGFRFVPQAKPRVFIAYVEEDLEHSRRLFDRLAAQGMDPWLDKRKLLPGQNWPRSIETAIRASDYFIACFSRRSVTKRGSFHCELRFALECARRVPLDEIFLIPVRLEPCVVPARITRDIQYIDLFPDWENGVKSVLKAIADQEEQRKRKQLSLIA